MAKICPKCGRKVFNKNWECGKDICKNCAVKIYYQNPENKKKRKEYEKSKAFKQSMRKYAQSKKGKIARKRFTNSLKGKLNKFKKDLKRREKENKIVHLFTIKEWIELKTKTNGYCPRCNNYVGIDKLELDHIIPISKAKEGQIYTIDDIQPLCPNCNKSKGGRIITNEKLTITKDFYFTIIKSIKEGLNLTSISNRMNISKQNLSYHLKPLIIDGIIKKVGYGCWEVNEGKLIGFFHRLHRKQVKKSTKVTINYPNSFTSFKPDNVRGHAFLFTLKIPKLPNWNKREEYLNKNNIDFKRIRSWGHRIIIDNFKIWLTPVSIVVYFPNFKSFMGETAKDTKNYAIYEFKRIISKIETLLRVSFRINNNYKFKVSRQHYALIKNSLAKQYDKEGNKMYCYTEQGLWFIIDNSYNLHEAETVHPKTGLTDNEKVQNWFNGLKETPITPKQILQMQYNQTKLSEYYAENIKTHTNSIIKLENSISIMNGLLKKMDKKMSQTNLRKWL